MIQLHLVNTQNLRAASLDTLLLLVAPIKGGSTSVVTTDIVEILHLVDTDDPVLRGEGLFDRVEDRSDFWHAGTTDTVLGLSRWEEGVVVVVGHLVPVKWLD
jgi:hypothetical protein